MDIALQSSTACFTGNRDLSMVNEVELSRRVDSIIARLYFRGYRRFFTGGALGFDTLAAKRVISFGASHDVQLILAIPCLDQAKKWSDADMRQYEKIKQTASEVRVLSPHFYEGCMDVRNRYMVNRSSFCISFMASLHSHSGTLSTVAYAISCNVPVVNLEMHRDFCLAKSFRNGGR